MPEVKGVRWIGSAKDDLSGMPVDVKYEVGQALWEIQCGGTPASTKPLHGNLRGVREIVVDDVGDTYRAIYTTNLGNVVYVLDAFKKKSKKGVNTPQQDLDRIAKRLRAAKEDYEQNS